jgi:ubiquinone/menaquinone biosynthesis C-methylase UbiE
VSDVNENHETLCASPEWAEHLQVDVLTPLLSGVDLGSRMIEVGPGPGAATQWLRSRVERLVAVEAERRAAETLTERYAGSNVEVLHGDATALRFEDEVFDAAGSFTMLHHVPTVEQQRRLLAEMTRVLRPGGVLVGSDSLATDERRAFHEGDTYNPVAPATLLTWLQDLGHRRITVDVDDDAMSFVAYRPDAEGEK